MTDLTSKNLRFECEKILNMIFDEKDGCDSCQKQALKALILVRDSHDADACARYKEYRCYKEYNSKVEKKLRELLF